MNKKIAIRKKYFLNRSKNYFVVKKNFFQSIIKILRKYKKKKLGLYYPTSHELDILPIQDFEFQRKMKFLLPAIKTDCSMVFYEWSKKGLLSINKYGIPEPIKSKVITPDIVLVPLLAFDKYKNRLGYGKGFYDKFLYSIKKKKKKIISIGVAFSFQNHHKLPTNDNDYKLDYVITEKGIIR